jgi:hypothetical protein
VRTAGPVSLFGTACALTAAAPLPAQTRAAAGLDLGMSHVSYDDFLPSLAAFAAVDGAVATHRTDVTARGAAVRFESGRHAFQTALALSHLAPGRGRTRMEASASTGASWYADFARFAHALGRARLLRAGRGRGAWVGVTLGTTSYGDGWRPVARYAAGGWSALGSAAFDASFTASRVGDTAYTDLEGTVRLPLGPLALDVWAGARMWSRGAGHGVYGEATLTLPLHGGLAVIGSGGRYPTDPVRGTIAGRYVSAGLRVSGVTTPRPAPPTPVPARPHYGSNGAFTAPAPAVEVALAGGVPTLRVHATGARTVELIGDVTDWLPVALTSGGDDRWEWAVPLPPGVRRLAVRVDGGPWLAPAGTRRVFDEFGSEVGLLIVP